MKDGERLSSIPALDTHSPTLIAATVRSLDESYADVIYVRHDAEGKARYFLYHAPNFVEQLKGNAPRTGPLVGDLVGNMEIRDDRRLLLAVEGIMDPGPRYSMLRKLDSRRQRRSALCARAHRSQPRSKGRDGSSHSSCTLR